jgi:hypothetical protein
MCCRTMVVIRRYNCLHYWQKVVIVFEDDILGRTMIDTSISCFCLLSHVVVKTPPSCLFLAPVIYDPLTRVVVCFKPPTTERYGSGAYLVSLRAFSDKHGAPRKTFQTRNEANNVPMLISNQAQPEDSWSSQRVKKSSIAVRILF